VQISRGNKRWWNALAFTFGVASIVACVALVGWIAYRRASRTEGPELLTTTVWKGAYDFNIAARGTLSSASSTEIVCEVRSPGGGTAIIDVAPEGAFVKKGDLVVTLDAGPLLEEEIKQKVVVSTRESLLAQAENTLQAAKIAKTEYLEGLYVVQERLLLTELQLAEQGKVTAEAALESAKSLYEKATIGGLQVEAAYTGLDDALNKLANAQSNLATLRNLTKEKELTVLEAGIASAEAIFKEHRRGLLLEQRRLKNIQQQIAKCTIRAPASGQIVYVNEPEYYRSSTYAPFVVEPGAVARERQVIMRLPNPAEMQVLVTVNEARVSLVRPGLPVSIRVDALDDEAIEGEVTKVNPFPEPSNFSSGSINKYGVTILIKNPLPELRVGMSAETWIHVEQSPEALQLPVQALAETNGRYFSLVKNGDEFETREIGISSINDQVAAIEGGLEEGDEVVINPRSAGDLLEFPDPDGSPGAIDSITSASRSGGQEIGGKADSELKPADREAR
jgi:HlyD family secretion protein